jgi:signal transduction histidine kinase
MDSSHVDAEQRFLRRVEELVSFNRHVAHDLRGPLVTIAAGAARAHEALTHGGTELSRQLMSALQHRAHRLSDLVASLLAMAEAADAPLLRARADLKALATEAADQVREHAAFADLLHVAVGDLPAVRGSATLLRQVFVNLFSNAAKFRNEPRASSVVVNSCPGPNDSWVIAVHDDGIGFDSVHAERLFQPFVRLHGAGPAGHGIGLSFVQRVVERHGGRAWATSHRPHGASFFFTLPADGSQSNPD